jgi:formylglycine-generating enzyme required for sulfatase activity
MSTSSSSGPEVLFTAARPKNPYPGLRPFEADEWSIFFGREDMIDEVIDRLAVHRLVLIHGPSGAGKSSLVRAGVLPKLERQHRRADAPWRTCTIRPSGGPLWNLAKELARLEGNADDADRVGQIVGQFNRRGATLSAVVASLKGFPEQRLCILVDQFEELFRFEKETSREEAELFVDLLVRSDVDAAERGTDGEMEQDRQPAIVHVIVTMRSEFLGECARFSGLAETVNRTQYLVPRMERKALLRAIRRPAELYGGEVTLDLADRLIADAGGREDELPLIQHGLMLMWHEAAARLQHNHKVVLDSAPLEAAGGLSRMLSAHADAAADAAAPDAERRHIIERLFRALTDVNVEGRAIRRPQAFRDLVAVTATDADTLRDLIEALRRDGVSFLTPYPPLPITDATPIDIGHEALIRCWDRLANPQNGWLKREFDDGLIWRLLLVESKSFERDKRHILSPVTTIERWAWWRDRKLNAAWAARYGGNFASVDKLLEASWRNARRQQMHVQYLVYILLFGIIAGLIGWINQSLIRQQWRYATVTLPYWYAQVRVYVLSAEEERQLTLKPGAVFKECAQECPEMVMIPAGLFMMGSGSAEAGRFDDERPQHQVTIAKPFAVSRFQVTFDDWDACNSFGACESLPADAGWGRGRRPVINVSWSDAQAYVRWLSRVTGKTYRLLSEAEYEYATRGGAATAFPWGPVVGQAMANCDGCGTQWDDKQTAPVGSFRPNAFDLYDMVGNVWEWTQDCYHESYEGAPNDGSAWVSGACNRLVVRGGAWNDFPSRVRSSARYGVTGDSRGFSIGFRVARTVEP